MTDALLPSREPQRDAAFHLIDQCIQRGLHYFFVAPGSRSTPLTIAIANHPQAEASRHFDERGLAFACLGYGRATGRAGVFVCTSGTAVANATAAVVEAALDHVPMLLLTADRPPELRDRGANQTIDQVKFFEPYARWSFDLPCATSESLPLDLKLIGSTVRHAARASEVGPVHVNCMFREPFQVADEPPSQAFDPPPLAALSAAAEATPSVTPGDGTHDFPWPEEISIPGGNCLVVVGGCRPSTARAAGELAARLQCPLLTDVTLGGSASNCPTHIPRHDLTLLVPSLPTPDVVIHVGSRIVSKRWGQFLEQHPPRDYLLFTTHDDRFDPTHQVTQVWQGNVDLLCRTARVRSGTSSQFLAHWQAAAKAASQCVARENAKSAWSEPKAMHAITEWLPSDHALLLGNSLPIRLADLCGAIKTDSVAANRGASGIDGLIATAVGFALGAQRATTAIVGDLSAMHDLNSLALLSQSKTPVHLVVFNNDGGGIFHLLPVAKQTMHFESYFAMPHGRQFADVAKMFELPYERVEDHTALSRRLANLLGEPRSTLTELTFNREGTADSLRQLAQAVRNLVVDPIAANEINSKGVQR